MGKKGRNAALLIILLALLIGVYVFSTVSKKNKDSADTSSALAAEGSTSSLDSVSDNDNKIAGFSADEVSLMSVTNASGTSVFVNDNGTWFVKDEKDFPLDQGKISTMIQNALDTTTDKKIPDNGDMEQYGLKKPLCSVTLTCATAGSVTINAGDSAPTGNGTYFSLGGDDVYLGDSSLASYFNVSLLSLIKKDETPAINADYITRLAVKGANGNVEVTRDPKNKWNTDETLPYVVTKGYERPVSAGTEKTKEILQNYTAFSLGDCVSYKAEDNELTDKYGLDRNAKSVSIDYYESENDYNSTDAAVKANAVKRFTLLIGNKDASEKNYYVKVDDSSLVYLMPADAAEKLVRVKPIDFVNPLVTPVNVRDLGEVDITAGDRSYTMKVDTAASDSAVSDSAADDVIRTFFWNGKKVDKSDFTGLYSSLVGITVDGEADRTLPEFKNDKAVLSVTFTKADGSKTKVTYFEYNENFYRAEVDGMSFFRANKKTVDSCIADIIKGI